jgi:hypothetical protein
VQAINPQPSSPTGSSNTSISSVPASPLMSAVPHAPLEAAAPTKTTDVIL